MAAKVDLVIFDCDGVLIDSEGLSAEVLIEALANLNLTVGFDYFCTNFVGRSFPTVARDIETTFDVKLPEGFEQRYRSELLARFLQELKPTEGIVDVLDALQVPFCIATSSSPTRASHSLNIVRLASRFRNKVFTASEVKRGKPKPDLFLHTAKCMGVDPSACLVIEDSLPGVEAAVAADMRVLRYTGGAHLVNRVLKHADYVPSFDKWPMLFDLVPELLEPASAP